MCASTSPDLQLILSRQIELCLRYKSTRELLLKMQRLVIMSDCVLGPDGKLLDATEITWYHDKDDDAPLPPSIGNSRPARRHIPSSHLTGDNAEAPQLKSHQVAIEAEQQRLRSLAKRNAEDASLSGGTSTPTATDSSEDEQLKPATHKGLTILLGVPYTYLLSCNRQTSSGGICI